MPEFKGKHYSYDKKGYDQLRQALIAHAEKMKKKKKKKKKQ